jgi:hypothetical protein
VAVGMAELDSGKTTAGGSAFEKKKKKKKKSGRGGQNVTPL